MEFVMVILIAIVPVYYGYHFCNDVERDERERQEKILREAQEDRRAKK